MTIRKIITYPDPVLRKKAKKITVFDNNLIKLAKDMGETMYNAPGVGLAANQIGVLQQIVVVDISKEQNEKNFIVLVNPEIYNGSGSVIDEEGCLSVPEFMSNVERFQKISVKAQDVNGKFLEFEAEDRFARIIQHEVDHLLGKLFIDRISALKRSLYKKKLAKTMRNKG